MKVKVEEEVEKGKRGIILDDSHKPSYYVEENELQDLLKEARYGEWSDLQEEGQELGKRLFNLLNRNSGELQNALENSANAKSKLLLNLYLPLELTEIPFEVLYYNDFIALQPNVHIVRKVADKTSEIEIENRPLKILFVAASPIDLENSTLEFEKEEDLILKATKEYPIDFQVEDTGSLEGIEQTLFEIGGTDILHLTAHAGHDIDMGPVFYIEDEIGRLDKVTPDRLFKSIKDFCPKVLFLSGCSTGKSDKNIGVESFAYQMVKLGIPYILSWGLPVSDEGATSFAGIFYEKLAKGKSLLYSIQESLLSIKKEYHPWPLMRLFTDGTKCKSLVKAGQRTLHKSNRQTIRKSLEDSNVQVLEKGFVGRRRELQLGLAVINNKADYEAKYGLLIHGPAGVGKSCLAGHILKRQSIYKIIIFSGELEQNIIIHTLKKFFDKQGDKNALGILGSNQSYNEKIKALYRTFFMVNNLTIYFDNFEDNLYCENNNWYLKSEFLNNFKPFLQYIDYTENQSKVVITSRYTFELQVEGKNISQELLLGIPLMSFMGADENKKLNELPNIARSTNFELYKQFGHGNPRLMDLLDVIAADEEKYNLYELKEALEDKGEDYRRKYLAELIAKAEGTDFMKFLYQSSVYRLPVEASAFEKFGNKTLLEKGVGLTLFEKEAVTELINRYWVMPVIRKEMWEKLNERDQKEAHNKALNWYDTYLENNEIIPYHNEALIHALAVNDLESAAKHVLPIGCEQNSLLNYLEQRNILEKVIIRLDETIISRAKKDKTQSISKLLNQYANLIAVLGDAKKAVEYYKKALQIDLEVFGGKYPDVATCYNDLGLAYKALGNVKKAEKYYKKALEIYRSVFGDKNSYVSTTLHNLGLLYKDLGDAKKAVEFYNKALEIDLEVLGDKHPNVAIGYNNLGCAVLVLDDAKMTVEYLDKALEIDLEVFGNKHPNVATRYNNLGGAYKTLGDANKSVEYYKKALQIVLNVYTKKHPLVSITLNNIGLAYQVLGDAKKTVEYFQKALEIDLEVFGDKNPIVIKEYLNLASIFKNKKNIEEELKYLIKVSEIIIGRVELIDLYQSIKQRIGELKK